MSDSVPDERPNDERLLAAIRNGDEEAFELLVQEHYAGLCAFTERLIGPEENAEELVQDVLFRVWQRRSEWTVTTTVAAYLYRAVRNHAVSVLRHDRSQRRWRDERTAEIEATTRRTSDDADAEIRAAELRAAIDRAIAALPPRCREAYVLRRQRHLSYVEIARIMDITPKTVEIQIGNALKLLRAALGEWLAD